jgi:hypothetical protein
MASSNFVAFYFAFMDKYDIRFWIPASLLILESIVLVLNRWKCPITGMAERFTAERKANFDIYLPEWLARYNKEIFTVLIILETVVVLIRSSLT